MKVYHSSILKSSTEPFFSFPSRTPTWFIPTVTSTHVEFGPLQYVLRTQRSS